jgi:hypothetical protein
MPTRQTPAKTKAAKARGKVATASKSPSVSARAAGVNNYSAKISRRKSLQK